MKSMNTNQIGNESQQQSAVRSKSNPLQSNIKTQSGNASQAQLFPKPSQVSSGFFGQNSVKNGKEFDYGSAKVSNF